MIVKEYNCNATLIKIDDENIISKEETEETEKILLSLIIKKII